MPRIGLKGKALIVVLLTGITSTALILYVSTASVQGKALLISAVFVLLATLVGLIFLYTIFTDIAQRKRVEQKLRQSAIVFDGTQDGIMITDPAQNIIAVNPAFSAISGFTEDEVIGKKMAFHKGDRQQEGYYSSVNDTLQQTGHWHGEIWNRRKNGETYPAWEDISAVKDDQKRISNYVVIFSDTSVIKESEQRLNHLAHHDVLTGLPNRLFFSVSLTQALERAKRYHQNLALLFIDLDRFKFINDTLGHAAGDLLLETVATRLKQCVRNGDGVARLGGDEFTITLSEITHRDDATTLCKKVLQAISQPILIDTQEVVISASIGVSLFPQDASCAEDLAKAADAAMYRAKEQGRDSYQFYSADLIDRAKEHLSLEQGLRQALAKNEFVLHYQPQFSLITHKMVGVEALIRWQHPHLGLISPTKFIPIAEETGLIEPIGEWVLESVCQQIGAWRAAGLVPPRVGVNISGRQIMRENIVSILQNIFEKHGLKEHGVHIELELTESVLQIAECSIAILHQLKSFGVTLAIDDFGTGYSSLSRLKHLPIDTLKIDRSFVSDISQGADDGAIATAVIAMGRSLSLKVIAEGAETEEQVNFLRDQGCNEVQGFFLGRPVAVAEVTPLLSHAVPYTVH